MTKINQDCDLNCIVHSPRVVEITAVCNNQFCRRVYVGMSSDDAVKTFKKEMKEGGKPDGQSA